MSSLARVDPESEVEFWDGTNRYHADSCLPLVAAVERGSLRLGAWVHGHYPGRRLPDAVLPQLLSAGYWSAETPQDWHLPRHRNEGIEITFVENGTLSFEVDERHFDLEPNALTVTRPWQAHEVGAGGMKANKLVWLIIDVGVRSPNQTWRWPDWILLDPPLLDELTRLIRENETPVWHGARHLRKCFDDIARTVDEPQMEGLTFNLLKVRINELLLGLLGHYRERDVPLSASCTSNLRAVEVFLALLEDELDEEWSLERMASRCGVGTTSLATYCRQLTNLSPLRYLNRLRMQKARRLLATAGPGASILDIALACGFSSSQYFAAQFRKETGLTPSRYREGAPG